jgi:branched-chain amino acid:cation transporter, LIVCS family
MQFLTQKFKQNLQVISVGMAMFSMFFGAGNVVFPLMIGQATQDKAIFAIIGLMITAIGVPFAGLFGMTLFDGDYRAFFGRLGKTTGFIIACLIMGLIGPFGAIPRCVTLSFSTVKMFFPDVTLLWFSVAACLIILFLTLKKSKITDILGYVLTPFLLGALALIIVKGIFVHPEMKQAVHHDANTAFLHGLTSGYHTMDLLGAFFFCAVVIDSLKRVSNSDHTKLFANALKASVVGAGCLALVYVGMSAVAALQSEVLQDATPDKLLSLVSVEVLGQYAGIITCIAVALACLTTAIALSVVFAEFLHYDILQDRINYEWSLIATLAITFIFSLLEFTGILAFLAPIVQLIYPSLLVLSLVNIAYKLWGFPYVKTPVFVTFIISLIVAFT